jgi:septal ring factor EnvC (AmiA/AmiB activator)
MTVEVAVLISMVSVAFSVYFGLKNNKRSDTKEIEERVRQDTIINTKLDSISQSIQEIKADIASMHSELNSHNDRLIVVEQSIKSAHKRLDSLEKKLSEGIGSEGD